MTLTVKETQKLILDIRNDAEFFNLTGYMVDEDGFLHLRIESR